jgi:hypothetical protein
VERAVAFAQGSLGVEANYAVLLLYPVGDRASRNCVDLALAYNPEDDDPENVFPGFLAAMDWAAPLRRDAEANTLAQDLWGQDQHSEASPQKTQ